MNFEDGKPGINEKKGKRLNKKSRVYNELNEEVSSFHNKVGRATDPDSDPDPKKWLQKTQIKFI
jgi:hypothetical protein